MNSEMEKLYCEKKIKFNSKGRRNMVKKIVLLVVLAAFALCVSGTSAAVVFEDNFNSYDTSGYPLDLGVVGADKWYTPTAKPAGSVSHEILVGGWNGGRVQVQNSYWGENVDLTAYAKLPSAMANCTVTVVALAFPGYENAATYYIVARATETSFVKLAAVDGGIVDEETEARALYVRLTDSDGGASGDIYLGVWEKASVISMSLTVNGNIATASVTNGSSTLTFSGATTVLDAGYAGFGAISEWNYAEGFFDNFVVSDIPEPATMFLMAVGLAVVRFRKK